MKTSDENFIYIVHDWKLSAIVKIEETMEDFNYWKYIVSNCYFRSEKPVAETSLVKPHILWLDADFNINENWELLFCSVSLLYHTREYCKYQPIPPTK